MQQLLLGRGAARQPAAWQACSGAANIYSILVTLEVFQEERDELKEAINELRVVENRLRMFVREEEKHQVPIG